MAARAAPAPANPAMYPALVRNVNYWRKYYDNGARPMTPAEVANFYQIHPYVVDNAVLPAPQPVLRLPPSRAIAPVRKELPDLQRQFLAQEVPGLQPEGLWRGVKFLGEGLTSFVGLWQYEGPLDQAPAIRKIAVKESQLRSIDDNLADEGEIMKSFQIPGSDHVVQLVAEPRAVDIVAEDLWPEWDGAVRRLFMEYCEEGSLAELLIRRIMR